MSNNEEIAQAMRDHHARLVSDLQAHVDALIGDVEFARDHHAAVKAVLVILEQQILPHASAEEQTIYPIAAGRDELRTLIDAMIREHRYLQDAIAALRSATGGTRAAADAETISTVFRLHAAKENDYVLPVLAADPGVNLSEVLSGMHALLESEPSGSASADSDDGTGSGVLDVRPLPPARRHQLIFSTFDGLAPGESFELVNDHDPKPLRYQLSAEHPDQFSWDYLESGPTAWRVRIGRNAA